MKKTENDTIVLLQHKLNAAGRLANFTEIGKELGLARITVRKYAKLLGMTVRSVGKPKEKTLDLSYFDSIDTPDKAYVLGFIYADGCNTGKSLQIGIAAKDVAVLEFIKKELKSSDTLRFIPKAQPTWSDKYELRVTSKDLSDKLTLVGCPPKKSLKLDFPDWISQDLMSHFIRGYFDGDGSVWCNKASGKSWHVNFSSGNVTFLVLLHDHLSQKLGVSGQVYSLQKGYSLDFSKKANVGAILKYIYKDSNFSMKRKKERYDKFCATL